MLPRRVSCVLPFLQMQPAKGYPYSRKQKLCLWCFILLTGPTLHSAPWFLRHISTQRQPQHWIWQTSSKSSSLLPQRSRQELPSPYVSSWVNQATIYESVLSWDPSTSHQPWQHHLLGSHDHCPFSATKCQWVHSHWCSTIWNRGIPVHPRCGYSDHPNWWGVPLTAYTKIQNWLSTSQNAPLYRPLQTCSLRGLCHEEKP